jgi:hypothetical protein
MFLRECKGGCLAWFAILVMVLINKNKKEVSMRNPFIAVFFLIWLSACAGPFYEEPVISDISDSKLIVQLQRGCSADTDNTATRFDVERVAKNGCGLYGHNAHSLSYRRSSPRSPCCNRYAYLYACSSEEVDDSLLTSSNYKSGKTKQELGEVEDEGDPFGFVFVVAILFGLLLG